LCFVTVTCDLRRACYTALMWARRSVRRLILAASLAVATFSLAGGDGAAAVGAQTRQTAPQVRADATNAARHVDRARLMRDVSTLAAPAFEGRRTRTAGAVKAREWITQQFMEIGLAPANGSRFDQTFTFADRGNRASVPSGAPPASEYPSANVIGRVSGRDSRAPTFVITAHYDHVGIRDGMLYPGADDNASGVAALLAAARHFMVNRPRHPMLFAALDAEEAGQHGAKALVASNLLPRGRTRLNINLDMVSRSDANEIYAAGTYYSPGLTPILRDVQARASVNILFGHDRPAKTGGGLEDWTHSSDHGPFHDAGMPFVYFGVEDHRDYHKPTDTADRIDPRFFGDAADMIVEAIRTFDARLD
jgi:hypothetical protein